MKKILHVILISLFSLTIISCAKKSSSSSSDTTSSLSTTSQMGGSIQGTELSLSTVVTTLKPTPSSSVSNPHLNHHKSDSLQVTPTNSSQSQTVTK